MAKPLDDTTINNLRWLLTGDDLKDIADSLNYSPAYVRAVMDGNRANDDIALALKKRAAKIFRTKTENIN